MAKQKTPMRAAQKLSRQFEALQEEVRENFLDLNRGSFRLTLVPGYRTDTLFGQPIGCAHPYVLSASGLSQTNSAGLLIIRIDDLLHCVGKGAPMPTGLQRPLDAGHDTIMNQTIAAGMPATVVTGAGPAPAVFTAAAIDLHDVELGASIVASGWRSLSSTLKAARRVEIRSFQLDGSSLPGANCNWHVTVDVWFTNSFA